MQLPSWAITGISRRMDAFGVCVPGMVTAWRGGSAGFYIISFRYWLGDFP